MTAAKTQIIRRNTDTAIREVIARHVAEGRITWQTALRIGANAIKELRMKGYSPAEVTAYLDRKVDEATTPIRRVTAEQIAARQAAADREERLRQAGEDAVDDWTEFRARHADNPLAAVALDIHQPVVEWDRVVCQECREADLDDTVGVEWPCGTYAAMKAAADG